MGDGADDHTDQAMREADRNPALWWSLMDDDEHEHAPAPTDEQWKIREMFETIGSVRITSFTLGIERSQVIRAVNACRYWLQDSGWTARYQLAKRTGFGEEDCRLHADQTADLFGRS